MDHEPATIAFYEAEAAAYTTRSRQLPIAWLDRFAALLPSGGAVLEIGCGGGHDAEALIARGFAVTATDASPEIARFAAYRLGRPVRVLLAADLDEKQAYDGVWAAASLLHVPRPSLAAIVAKIRRALKPSGVFFTSYKAGERDGRDALGRYYKYPSADWLRKTYEASGPWRSLSIESAPGGGYDGQPATWLYGVARSE